MRKDKDEENSVSIKMYIERERMVSMKDLIPGMVYSQVFLGNMFEFLKIEAFDFT